MKCLNPILITTPNGQKVHVSCTQCVHCRITRQEAWVGRLSLESAAYTNITFTTLTYEKDPLELDYEDFQLFMKRLRKELSPETIRFAVCGEYGEKNCRGHWHAIIFGLNPYRWGKPDDKHFHFPEEIWPNGFTTLGPITKGALRYVAGYCLKRSSDGTPDKIWQTSRNPGLGLDRIRKLATRWARVSQHKKIQPEGWPIIYKIGKHQYPLIAGGLTAFKAQYEEDGGILPETNLQINIDWMKEIMDHRLIHNHNLQRLDPYYGKKEARKTNL